MIFYFRIVSFNITKDTVVPQKRILPSCAKTKSICCFMNCTMTKKVMFNSVKVGASATYTKTPNKQNNLLDLNHYIVSGIWCIEFITANNQFLNNFISLRKKESEKENKDYKILVIWRRDTSLGHTCIMLSIS